MKTKLIIKVTLLVVIIHLSVIGLINAQNSISSSPDRALYTEIKRVDSILFTAFNLRDTATFKSMLATNLEFYHDKDGLTGFDHTMDFMRETAKSTNRLRRELVQGSLEVYPIPGYGAMEMGSHVFCHMENGKEECATFGFAQIWQKQNGSWKLTRVLSYGHKIN